jgi:MYXO-CTERM domain-containing protein
LDGITDGAPDGAVDGGSDDGAVDDGSVDGGSEDASATDAPTADAAADAASTVIGNLAGGCACNTAGSDLPGPALALVVLAFTALMSRRRHRRRTS